MSSTWHNEDKIKYVDEFIKLYDDHHLFRISEIYLLIIDYLFEQLPDFIQQSELAKIISMGSVQKFVHFSVNKGIDRYVLNSQNRFSQHDIGCIGCTYYNTIDLYGPQFIIVYVHGNGKIFGVIFPHIGFSTANRIAMVGARYDRELEKCDGYKHNLNAETSITYPVYLMCVEDEFPTHINRSKIYGKPSIFIFDENPTFDQKLVDKIIFDDKCYPRWVSVAPPTLVLSKDEYLYVNLKSEKEAIKRRRIITKPIKHNKNILLTYDVY